MTPIRIARLDLRRVSRSPGIAIASAVFAAILLVGIAVPWMVLEGADATIGSAFLLGPAVDLVLPVIAILVSYASVAGLRDDGSIKVILGTPTRRRDIVFGLVVSRIIASWVIVAAGLAVALVGLLVLYGLPPWRPFFGFAALTVLAAASFTAVGVGISALVGSTVRTIAVLIGGFVIAGTLWEPLCRGLYYLGLGASPGQDHPRWFEFVLLASPMDAYTATANGILPPSPHLAIAIDESGASAQPGELVGGEFDPLLGAVSVGVLLAWPSLCLFGGLRRLRKAEIE